MVGGASTELSACHHLPLAGLSSVPPPHKEIKGQGEKGGMGVLITLKTCHLCLPCHVWLWHLKVTLFHSTSHTAVIIQDTQKASDTAPMDS